jgi:hypothetical protein
MAYEHVAWMFWTRRVEEPTPILGHGSAFLLDRGGGPMLVTAAHVYRQYVEDWRREGPLECQVANALVSDLSKFLIDCGNLAIPLDEPDRECDIATFRLPPGATERLDKKPLVAVGDWPPPPAPNQQVMVSGFPGDERIVVDPSTINFGFYAAMTSASSVTDHQLTIRFEREFMVDQTGNGLPPPGYGLGGISGAPLLIPEFNESEGVWAYRFGGVISQAPDEAMPDEVFVEAVVAHRAEYILPNGKLQKML